MLVAFYEKCGFSQKENEMVSVESAYQIVSNDSPQGEIRNRDTYSRKALISPGFSHASDSLKGVMYNATPSRSLIRGP
jgi:hypothetical protein